MTIRGHCMFYEYKNNVLPIQECDQLIDLALKTGFEPAKVQVYGEQKSLNNIRNNTRLEFDDKILAQRLEYLLKDSLQDKFPSVINNRDFFKMSSHFRMYCYEPGQYFKPHRDGHYKENDVETLITALFYLNTTIGGQTILMPKGFKEKDSWITISPVQESVLMFEHDIFHEGLPVTQGEKYVLRTDLFYK